MKKNRSRLAFYLGLLVALSLSCSAADFRMTFTIPAKAELELSTSYVDLGPFHSDRVSGHLYFEKNSAVQVRFGCNLPTEWEVRISGTDFRSGVEVLPISKLQWKAGGSGSYQYMPPQGDSTVVASWREYNGQGKPVKDHKNISYRLELTGEEYEGQYLGLVTYTMFIP